MANLSVGDVAPSFELPDQQDHPWSLSGQLEVSPVVLIFYRGDWCPYCNGQLAAYARKYNEFERRGTQPAAISVDPPVHNARMVGKLQIPFPLLSDPKGEVARAYGHWNERENVAVPAVVIVNRAGEITYLHAGSDPADRPTDGEVFAALKALKEPGVPGTRIERRTGGPELRTTAVEARHGSARPASRQALGLHAIARDHTRAPPDAPRRAPPPPPASPRTPTTPPPPPAGPTPPPRSSEAASPASCSRGPRARSHATGTSSATPPRRAARRNASAAAR